MDYTITGTIDTVFNEETVGNNGFKKRIVWIKTDEQYPQDIEIQFVQTNTDLPDGYQQGDKVEIKYGLRGKKSNGNNGERIFNSLNGFGIRKL